MTIFLFLFISFFKLKQTNQEIYLKGINKGQTPPALIFKHKEATLKYKKKTRSSIT
jgi:hypothetical protein